MNTNTNYKSLKKKKKSEENNSSYLKDTPKIISVPEYLQARDLKPAPPKRFCKLTIKHSISFILQKQLASKYFYRTRFRSLAMLVSLTN